MSFRWWHQDCSNIGKLVMASEFHEDRSRGLYEQGRQAFLDQDFARAVELLRESDAIRSSDQGHPVTSQYLALSHMAIGKPDEAVEVLSRVQESGREHSGVVIAMMQALYALGQSAEAREYWNGLPTRPQSIKLAKILEWMETDGC